MTPVYLSMLPFPFHINTPIRLRLPHFAGVHVNYSVEGHLNYCYAFELWLNYL